jgi:RNA polymerase sigma-70 factor (ECF subfamily)
LESFSEEMEAGAPDAPPRGRQVDVLLREVYDELHRLALTCFRGQRVDHTLQPTALVHEAYLRLSARGETTWNDRRHFFCVAATAMRQILVNHARDRGRQKRGGGQERVPITGVLLEASEPATDVIALDTALERLAGINERKSRIVELRYFAGLSVAEVADVLGVSETTVKSDWALSKAWLLEQLSA